MSRFPSACGGRGGQVERKLDDLVEVVPAVVQAILVEGALDLGPVERQQVNDLREVGGQPDQPEHVPDLASGQPVDVVDEHEDRLGELAQRRLDGLPLLLDRIRLLAGAAGLADRGCHRAALPSQAPATGTNTSGDSAWP